MLAIPYDLHAIDEDVIDTLRIGIDAKLVAGHVIPVIARTAADRLGIENHEIGVIPELRSVRGRSGRNISPGDP